MKQILAFVFGGILIGGVVWVTMKEKAPEPLMEPVVKVETPAAVEMPAPVSKPSAVATTVKPKVVAEKVPEKVAEKVVEKVTATPVAPPAPKPAEVSAPVARVETPVAPPPPPARVAKTVTLTDGTQLSIRLAERLSSDVNMSGDEFTGTLDKAVVVDGFVIAERNAKVTGKISEVDKAGRVKGVSRMVLELSSFVTADGQTIAIRTSPMEKLGDKDTKNDAKKVGIGAAIGAGIGAIAGGGKGAAIGAAAGAGAGAGAAVYTKGPAVEFPVETRLTFALTKAVSVTEKLK